MALYGRSLNLRGATSLGNAALKMALGLGAEEVELVGSCTVMRAFAEMAIQLGSQADQTLLQGLQATASGYRMKIFVIYSQYLNGLSALKRKDLLTADKSFRQALDSARRSSIVEMELACQIGFSRIALANHNYEDARSYLDRVWEQAERGPFPILRSEALVVLAKIESLCKDNEAASQAAAKALELAELNGTGYCYHHIREEARAVLKGLSTAPNLPPPCENEGIDIAIFPPNTGVPTLQELLALPRWVRVALAAKLARFCYSTLDVDAEFAAVVERGIQFMEESARVGNCDLAQQKEIRDEFDSLWGTLNRNDGSERAFVRRRRLAEAIRLGINTTIAKTPRKAAERVFQLATLTAQFAEWPTKVRSLYEAFRKATALHAWNDQTLFDEQAISDSEA